MNQTRTLPDCRRSRNDHDGRVRSRAVVLDAAIHKAVWLEGIPAPSTLGIDLKRGFR